MKLCRLHLLLTVAVLATCSYSAAQAQSDAQPKKQETAASQDAGLKLVHWSPAPYPDEALKKGIEGRVTVSFVVNANGRVTDAKALSGPPELFQAAMDSAKEWQFEPPANAPVTMTAEVAYGFPRGMPRLHFGRAAT